MNTITKKMQVTWAAVAAVCLASTAMAAGAADTTMNVPAVTVHYSDLKLNTEAGAAILYNRIRNAATQVCGDRGSKRLDEVAATKACVDRAILASVRSVNNPKLTREYNARMGVAQKTINVASGP
jgi:UrcA family protein